MYGSDGFSAERNIETPTQKLASFISPKPSEANPVSPSSYYSDEVSDRSFEIALWLTVSGKHQHSKVIKLTCEKLKQQQRGAIRLMQILQD